MTRLTEKESPYNDLEKKSVSEILHDINREDHKVAAILKAAIPDIEPLVESITLKIKAGGRLFYIGAGTSGRLGVLDASECPPTFGVDQGVVIGLIAGGDGALRKAVEFAEDDIHLAWKELINFSISKADIVIGIAASGSTPYVVHGLKDCQSHGVLTACITCSPLAPVMEYADHPVLLAVGPEYITGSTRMKAGTAQKLCLNMISTSVMIRLGRVKGNRMVDMQLANNKLVDRGIRMIMEESDLNAQEAKKMLAELGSVRLVLTNLNNNSDVNS